jgi:hypothetical protein
MAIPAIAPVEIGELELVPVPVPSPDALDPVSVPCPAVVPDDLRLVPVDVGEWAPVSDAVAIVTDVPPIWDAIVASCVFGIFTPSTSQMPAAPLVGRTPM